MDCSYTDYGMQELKERVCCVIPSLASGGMERVMATLVNGFVDYNIEEIHLILYGSEREVFYKVDQRVIIHTPSFEFNNRFRTLNTVRTLFYLRKEIKRIRPKSVLSFGCFWNSFVLLATLGLHLSVYVSDRSSPNKKYSKVQSLLRRYLYPYAAGVIAQTSKAEDIYKKLYRNDNSIVIGNPINEIDTQEQYQQQNTIVSVGRLIATKHYDRLIKLFHELNRPDWKLVIVGGDAQKQDRMKTLKEQIVSYGDPDNIILAGTQKNVPAYLKQSKIFAFTSSSEGFPNVIGEAMSAGLPVVSYNCVAGPSDLVEDGKTGFLVEPFDDESFKDRLLRLMDDESLRLSMGEAGKQKVKEFSAEEIIKRFYVFITEK